jgi:inner membrane protein
MDPLSHAVTGAALGGCLAKGKELRAAMLVGMLAGTAPDLDVFIRSASDPLLQLEYHRGFTHSLLFAPVLALVCAAVFHPFVRSRLRFGKSVLVCFLALVAHALLDAATSYGTNLWWPLSDARVGWSWIAVIDPLYTLPGIVLVVVMLWSKGARWGTVAILWMIAYVGLGMVQNNRAVSAIEALAMERGHELVVIEAKPSLFNNILFRSLYRYGDHYYVDAVRVGYFSKPVIYPGEEVEVFVVARSYPKLDLDSRLARDIERFSHFSMGYLYVPPGAEDVIADLRYSMVPNSIQPLWGIRIDVDNADAHAPFENFRQVDDQTKAQFFGMLFGSW